MPQDDNPSEVNQSQVAAKDLTAGRDIRIGSIVQTIVNLGLPFNSQHLRFVQFLANSAYLICLIWGFIRLWQNGADLTTMLLLIVGSGLLSLTCLYYAWFWKPEVRDRSTASSELADSNELEKAQQIRARSRQQIRRLAIVGFFAIPLLTFGGFLGWRSLPPPNLLLLVADFDGIDPKKYGVTERILNNLRLATEPYSDVKVSGLEKIITEQQGSEVARAEGEQKKAAIVIWGDYDVTETHVQVSTHFEVLEPPTGFPELGTTTRGEGQIAAIAELKSFKLQTRLSNEMSYLTLFTLGMVQYAKEDWDGAVKRFKSALDQAEEPVTALSQHLIYFYRGNAYASKSDYKKAIEDYTQVLKLKPDLAEVYYNRGVALHKQENYNQAIADYTQAIKLKPNYTSAYQNRGVTHREQGNFTQAIADYTQALTFDPKDAEIYSNRGGAYAQQNNFTKAFADFNQAIKLKPDYAMAYSNRGNAYSQQGNFTQAFADFTQALKLKPDLAEAYNNRGNAYTQQGKYIQAIADFNQAIKLEPDFALAYTNRGNAYTSQGNHDQAIVDFNQAIKLKPDYALAYSGRGSAYTSQGNFTQAIADYNQSLKLDPNSANTYNGRGLTYAYQKNYVQAIVNYTQALKLKPDFAEAYDNRGRAYAQQDLALAYANLGQTDTEQNSATQSIADLNQAIKLKPDITLFYYDRGNTYYVKGNYTQAIADYTQAIKLDPNYAQAYTTRGLVYGEQGNKNDAILDFKKTLELTQDPTMRQMAEQNLRELGAK